MKKKRVLTLTVAMLLIALAGLAPVSPARAQAQRTPLAGEDQRFFGVPGRVWVANGLTQIRDLPLTGNFAFSGAGVRLSGSENQVTNAVLDGKGNGITWGTGTYSGFGKAMAARCPLHCHTH